MSEKRRTPISRIVYAGTVREGFTRFEDASDSGRRSQADASHSIRCVQAGSTEELALAQRFWMQRYRQAGLGGFDEQTPGFESLSLPEVPSVNARPIATVSRWRSTTFVAYCQHPTTHSTSANARTHAAQEWVCGTVALLTPWDFRYRSGNAPPVGRITHLAVDHAPLESDHHGMGDRSVFLELTSCMHRSALQIGLTHLDAIVHPRHAKLYRRVFGAIPIGEPFACEQVGGSPGQYMRADITQPSHFHSRLRARYEAASLGETG